MIQLENQYNSGLMHSLIIYNYLKYPKNEKNDEKDNNRFLSL